MKNLFISLGTVSTAVLNVFQMDSFNPATFIFWSTLTGIFVWTILGGIAGLIFFESLEKLKDKWNGIGRIHSKDL